MRPVSGRTIAVTGASGFIGARIVEYLIMATEHEVVAIVRSFSRLSRLSELPQNRLRFARADVLDPIQLDSALAGCDVVVQCAYGAEGRPEQQRQTTVVGTQRVLEAAARGRVCRFVHLSTAAVHDVTGLRIYDENAPKVVAPELSYETAKLDAEMLVLESGLSAVLLRPTVVYGPWGKDWTITPLRRLAAGEGELPRGSNTGISNAVYVDDVARAVLLACDGNDCGPVLVGSDEQVTWGRFYDAFRDLLPRRENAAPDSVAAWERELYAQTAKVDISRARSWLGYEPKTTFEDGMANVGAWWAWLGR